MEKKEELFLAVIENHKGIIYKVANAYCHDKADQDDLIQEISLQVWLSLQRFNDQYKWSTWIYRIALNTAISFYRKNKARKEKTERLSPIIEVPDIGEIDSEDEDFILLRSFVQALKEIERALIILHLEGLSSKEIATILDTTQTNVTTKISRIKKKLKHQFTAYKIRNHGKH